MTTMPDTVNRDVQPIEKVLLWIVLAFRVLGWFWLALLAVAALIWDEQADKTIVVAMLVGSGLWTIFTVYASRTQDRIKHPAFVVADGIVALLVASASYFAEAGSNLHGGYPISWIAVVAYAADVRWAMAASMALFVNQWVGMDIEGSRTITDKLGAVVFPVYGAIVGAGFDLVRQRDALWRDAEQKLQDERRQQVRHDEQLRLADQLHDSVLQSLHAIRVDPDEADRVAWIARQQERELRKTIHTLRSPYDTPFVTAMFTARDDVEELYRIEIDMVCGYDTEMTIPLAGLVEATREAMINAAKHSGSDKILVYCTAEGDHITCFVRDRGVGIDKAGEGDRDPIPTGGHGIANSITRRLEGLGGTATIHSTTDFGTEVEMTVPKEA